MSSRTIHTRLPDTLIAQCYDLLEALQLDATGPPSSAVARALTMLVEPLDIAERPPEQAAALIKQRAKPVLVTHMEEEEPPGQDYPELPEELYTPAAPPAELPPAEEAAPPVLEKPPWEGHREIPFDLVKGECPKDRFVELALSGEPLDPFLVKAIEITYVMLGREWWGSSKAEQLIAELMDRFHHFAETTGETL